MLYSVVVLCENCKVFKKLHMFKVAYGFVHFCKNVEMCRIVNSFVKFCIVSYSLSSSAKIGQVFFFKKKTKIVKKNQMICKELYSCVFFCVKLCIVA